MSGITGIFFRDDRSVDSGLIEKINDRLTHRGPDRLNVWFEDSVGFGHKMLYTTPESLHEELPLIEQEKRLVITADARIDNRKELSKELDIEDKEDVSDSYFILKSYEKWGERCPEYLLGDFAFAIWDENKEKLFCSRDHLGVKPFYYYLDDNVFVFGSEIKALFDVVDVPCKLNELKVAHHLIPIITDRELTFYEDIYRLPAAQTLSINRFDHQKKIYWQLNPDLELKFDSDEEYYDKFREIFGEAVKCRLRSDFKVGFELSGGIDSSSVVGMAKTFLSDEDKDIHTFSLIFNEIKETDERYFIQKVVETGRIKPYYLIADSISPFNEIEDILSFQDEPLDTPNIALIWQLYKLMAENGVKIILGGHDGDSLLYKGEKYLMELFVNLRWKKLIQEIKSSSNGKIYESLKLFINKVIFPIFPVFLTIWLKFKGVRREKDFVNINEDFERRLRLKEKYEELELKQFRNANTSKKIHYYYLTLATHQYIFEMMDKIAGAFSMEARHPMMDKRLVEYCYAVPTNIKYDHGWGRLLARRGLSDLLPKEVRWRKGKCNFFPVFERNLLLFEMDRLDNLLNKNELIKDYVNYNELNKIYKRYMDENEGADSIDIWKIAILSLWMNHKQYLTKI